MKTKATSAALILCLAVLGARTSAQMNPNRSANHNLLLNSGFEELETAAAVELSGSQASGSALGPDFEYAEHREIHTSGGHRHVAGWEFKCFHGNVELAADLKEVAEGTRSLRLQFMDAEANSNVMVGQRNIPVRPNTVYKLSGMVKPYQALWNMSHCRFNEYADDGDVLVGTGHRRMIVESTARAFRPMEVWYVTGPTTTRLSLMMFWRGRPQVVGIVRQPSMVWLDDLRLVEVGAALSPVGEVLAEGFESGQLDNWWVVRPGGRWQQEEGGPDLDLRISTEEVRSGSRSLKLGGNWSTVERVFSQRLTDCVVSLWFRDELAETGRTRMFLLVDERASVFPHAGGSRGVGLGGYRESATHYSWFAGPHVPCPYCGRKSRDDPPQQVTAIERTAGWHELKWDITAGEGIVFYVDGEEVGRTDRQDGFRILQLGEDFWNGFTCYVDDLRIEFKDRGEKEGLY